MSDKIENRAPAAAEAPRNAESCCFACHALCGVEITRYSWRDRALWGVAAFAVMTCYAVAGVSVIAFSNAPMQVGAPPSAVMVEFAPELAAPTMEDRDVAIGPQAEARAASAASDASDAPEENLEEIAEAEGDGEEVVLNPHEAEIDDAEQKIASLVDTPQDVEEVRALDPTIPDVVEAENPEVVVPEATAASAAPESATMVKPHAASAPTEASVEAQPEIQEKFAEVAMAPAQIESKAQLGEARKEWMAKLAAYLEAKKNYPLEARSRRETGTVYVQFRIDGAGRLISARISKSSGSTILDNSVLTLLDEASPMPAPPVQYASKGKVLTVPFTFNLR
ncbi:TonB family protein [Methyloligella sp. 2.7D]|uniref:energy transducer TonB family protein n=1 Tax=unclassified Methyloligella TaxID=2625955 RepID=UPI00157CB899|nr:TonB family protein [Methyloligella sp. GL2]QKP78395.1 TonB family protein [Methyloligella sp. GL2]